MTRQNLLRAAEQGEEKRLAISFAPAWDFPKQADAVRSPLAQATPRLLRHIAERPRRIDDTLARDGVHIGAAVESAGDRADRNSEAGGEIANALRRRGRLAIVVGHIRHLKSLALS